MVLLSDKSLHELKKLAQEVCQRDSCRLYDLDFTGGSQCQVLRIFAMRADENISLEQCANISRGLSWILDTQEDLIPSGSYSLEVSSPGLERILKEKWHFEEAIQEFVKFKLHHPLEKLPDGISEKLTKKASRSKHFSGFIIEVQDNKVIVEFEQHYWEIYFDNIKRAQVTYNFKSAQRGDLKAPLPKLTTNQEEVKNGCR